MKVTKADCVRYALLVLVPFGALALSSWSSKPSAGVVLGVALASASAVLLDCLRQRLRVLPFPIYLLIVYALQTAVFVSAWHGSSSAWLQVPADGKIRTMSIVMAAHSEHRYMKRTLDSIYETTPGSILKEIIVVDDASDPPLADSLRAAYPDVTFLRHDTRQGLIKSKIRGGNMATADMIMFLDAHVKPEPRWAEPILRHMNVNYRRVVVPLIPILDGDTWVTNNNAVGVKMMFDWSLHFSWFDDGNDLVPCMSGGLFGITRQWWHESGEYDYGMRMWGAENIEQSIRVWLCGGEIYVARDSRVAHVFRPKFPYPINNTEIYMNKVRTVETWFDNFGERYYDADPAARQFVSVVGNISERRQLKERLHCRAFSWYMEKFKPIFIEKGMLPADIFQMKDNVNGRCVQAALDDKYLEEAACDPGNPRQQWTELGTLLRNVNSRRCMFTPGQLWSLTSGREGDGPADAELSACRGNSQRHRWLFRAGYVRWQGYCLNTGDAASSGRMKISPCESGAQFLGRERTFARIKVRDSVITDA
eukprot:TRINITY_DN23481_c0_g2_i1.p1 TRINITY_DN23481_c0_g2~~TRINITY_DN23481_c0_g2_i1.p1  ORF type:complete len:536 (-),score=133.58 TRINITY_DN23481_c0_g2_i1:91-1698(-)